MVYICATLRYNISTIYNIIYNIVHDGNVYKVVTDRLLFPSLRKFCLVYWDMSLVRFWYIIVIGYMIKIVTVGASSIYSSLSPYV